MTVIIIGSMGRVGRRLMPAFPGAIGIDRLVGADIVADLSSIDYDEPRVKAAFEQADGVIHVATSADATDPDHLHWLAVIAAARLLDACDRFGIRRVVIPSSDWADPRTRWAENDLNIYGHSKRVFEAMAHMYNIGHTDRHCVALRIGWVPNSPDAVPGAAAWLQANYWDDARLIAQVKSALGD